MNRCIGCGVILQTTYKNELGFIPKEKLNEQLCERCFRLNHYNDYKIIDLKTDSIIDTVNKSKSIAFFLVDLLNINKEVIDTFKKITIPKTLIISKIDYIPKYIKKEKIKAWLESVYEIKDEITFLSAIKNYNINNILNIMVKQKRKSAYLLGFTNVGKSTLVNSLISKPSVTMSIVPNTTIDYLKINLIDDYYLIDSPGFQYKNPIYKNKDMNFFKKLNPKKVINPITYQLKEGTSLVIEDILRIEITNKKCNLTMYTSNLLNIKKIYAKNNLLQDKNLIELNVKSNEDIVINGLGFINVKSASKINLYVEDKEWVQVRKSFFER